MVDESAEAAMIRTGTLPSAEATNVTLAGFLRRCAGQFAEREAIVWEDQRWTYDRLLREAERVACGLGELGVTSGHRVGVLLPNWPEMFAAVFGATALGAEVVALNTMATPSELAYLLDHGAVETLIYTPSFLRHDYQATLDGLAGSELPEARAAAARLGHRIALRRSGGTLPPAAIDFADLGGDGNEALGVDRGDPRAAAMIFYTSGSTARPKAVVHSHAALVHQALVASDAFGLGPDDRSWGCLPMFFTGGFVIVALVTFATGGTLVLQDHFEAGHALDLMERENITFYAGWQLAPALCDHPSFAKRRLSLCKGIFSNVPVAGRLLPPDHRCVGAYGMSETATVVCAARSEDPLDLRLRGFGRPLPGAQVRIVDPETRAHRPPGEVGEILVKSPASMLGYLGIPPRESFDAEGFFATGDYGRLDETGTLLFDGRLKEVIKTAGVNVAAAEVEACLEKAGGVAAAYVVPVPHEVRGENVAVFLVPARDATIDVAQVLEHGRRDLASYKLPRHVFLLTAAEVPRTGTQKVDKPCLRRWASERAGTPADLLAEPAAKLATGPSTGATS